MEFSKRSTIDLSDSEFKYIPKSSLENVIRKVESERMSRDNEMWESFCTITSVVDGVEVVKHIGKIPPREMSEEQVLQRLAAKLPVPSSEAPLLGPLIRRVPNLSKNESHAKAQAPSPEFILPESPSHRSLSTNYENNQNASKFHKIVRRPSLHIVEEDDIYPVENIPVEDGSDCSDEDSDYCGNRVDYNKPKNAKTLPATVKIGKLHFGSDKSGRQEQWERIIQTFGSYVDEELDLLDERERFEEEQRSEKETFQSQGMTSLGLTSWEFYRHHQRMQGDRYFPFAA